MQLVFNELSLLPLSESVQVAEKNLKTMIETFKKAKEVVGFKSILFQNNLSNQIVVNEISFLQLLKVIENKDLKRALITFLNPPYLDDLTNPELEEFYSSEYQIIDEGCPTEETPYGFPVAYIRSLPTISTGNHQFWKKLKIKLEKSGVEEIDNVSFSINNICTPEDIKSPEFKDWISTSMAFKIEDKDGLSKFLDYTKYETSFEDSFFSQLMDWKEEDRKIYKYTLALMKDVELHPFTGGIGQTENLKKRGKEASKRITNSYPDGDRLSYSLENDLITFISCKGHYKFH